MGAKGFERPQGWELPQAISSPRVPPLPDLNFFIGRLGVACLYG